MERDWTVGLALRLPSTKKDYDYDYDTMVHNQKQFADIFRKHGCYARSFQLDSTVTSEGFIVYPIFSRTTRTTRFGWMDLEFYRDRKHMDEYSLEKRTN